MKVTPAQNNSTVTFKTKDQKIGINKVSKWWEAKDDQRLAAELLSTVSFLKQTQGDRQRAAALYARLYGNSSLFNFVGTNMHKMNQSASMPTDRPTFNLLQSCVDTLVSKITQDRPSPVFLTDNSDYKERNLAKKLNNFIQGEFYQTKAYDKAATIFKDALIEGTGCLKVYESDDHKVALERVLLTELFIDPTEGIYGEPRRLYQLRLVDREVLMAANPKFKNIIATAERSYVDTSVEASKTVGDLVMVCEAWSLPSGKDAKDGRHTIACTSGIILDEVYEKDKFPFVFFHYSKRLLGFWSQGLAEQLMGTQLEINSLLYTISRSIKLVGVPRVFQEIGSKVVKSHHNNDIGVIIEYRGTKPSYEVAPSNAPELYTQLERLIQFGYKQAGISQLDAAAQKPSGLNSGEAIRSYDDISTDRFAYTARSYNDLFVELAYAIIDKAMDICKEQGKYQTIYPNKNGVKEIDLPKASLLKNPFVIQCFNMSSLPKDPAGRMQKITEMIQAGMITIQEGRRLLEYPDTQQMDMLANASEERIFNYLDQIIEDGKYNPPDPFMNMDLATQYVVAYYNLYVPNKLEEEKIQMLNDFYTQCLDLKQAAMPPAPGPQAAPPQANPQPTPTSPLIPNGANPVAATAA